MAGYGFDEADFISGDAELDALLAGIDSDLSAHGISV